MLIWNECVDSNMLDADAVWIWLHQLFGWAAQFPCANSSTLRFLALPSDVEFEAMGVDSPNAEGLSRLRATPTFAK